jgi:hypothetical protein
MTPEEKAKELFNHYYNLIQRIGGYLEQEILVSILAKECALIAVDEIIDINSVDKDFSLSHYWLDVKEEIENL